MLTIGGVIRATQWNWNNDDPSMWPGWTNRNLVNITTAFVPPNPLIPVRGFLAGVVRKKLGLNLVSEQTDKGRVYRIKDGKASSATVDRVKQAA